MSKDRLPAPCFKLYVLLLAFFFSMYFREASKHIIHVIPISYFHSEGFPRSLGNHIHVLFSIYLNNPMLSRSHIV
jgi:hypothetical protein